MLSLLHIGHSSKKEFVYTENHSPISPNGKEPPLINTATALLAVLFVLIV